MKMRVFQAIKPFVILCFIYLIFYYSCQRTSTEPQNDIDHEPIITINEPPVISSIIASPDPVQLGKTTTITCNASDPNDDSLSYNWGVALVSSNQNDSSYSFNWDVDLGSLTSFGATAIWQAPIFEGLYVILCKIVDIAGYNDVSLLEIEVVTSGCLYVMTDKVIYSYGDTIVCKLKNETDSTAYFFYCSGLSFPWFSIDKRINDKWELYALVICDGMHKAYVDGLIPGEAKLDTHIINLSVGTHRFNIPYSWKDDWNGDYPSPDSLFSNIFYVQ